MRDLLETNPRPGQEALPDMDVYRRLHNRERVISSLSRLPVQQPRARKGARVHLISDRLDDLRQIKE